MELTYFLAELYHFSSSSVYCPYTFAPTARFWQVWAELRMLLALSVNYITYMYLELQFPFLTLCHIHSCADGYMLTVVTYTLK